MIGFMCFITAMLLFMFVVGFIAGKNYQQDKEQELDIINKYNTESEE